jgi:hypothetical protein
METKDYAAILCASVLQILLENVQVLLHYQSDWRFLLLHLSDVPWPLTPDLQGIILFVLNSVIWESLLPRWPRL